MFIFDSQRSLRLVLLTVSALMTLASGALGAQRANPSEVFEWRQAQSDLGEVELPPDIGGGWHGMGEGVRFRRVPSYSTDPTFEVLFGPGTSGAPRPERIIVQVPANFSLKPLAERAVVVGFHSYSRSEKQVLMETDLPDICAQRGWLLVAPYGLVDTSFGRPEAQDSLEAVLGFLHGVLKFDRGRIYGVGFSMGAHGALSYAMRHQDPDGFRFAAVVFHTGRLDLVRNFELGNTDLRLLMMDSEHFGGSPAEVLFEYERVSPARLLPTGEIYWARAPVSNLLHIPVFIHANLADPDPTLVSEAMELRNFLGVRGGLVIEDFVLEPHLGHSWQSIHLESALDAVTGFRLDGAQPAGEVFADQQSSYHHFRVLERTLDFHGNFRFEWQPAGLGTVNGFAVRSMRDVRSIAVDLAAAGLDTSLPLAFECSSRDGAVVEFILEGYPSAPLDVISVYGLRWTYDAATDQLRIRLRTNSAPTIVDVVPSP